MERDSHNVPMSARRLHLALDTVAKADMSSTNKAEWSSWLSGCLTCRNLGSGPKWGEKFLKDFCIFSCVDGSLELFTFQPIQN